VFADDFGGSGGNKLFRRGTTSSTAKVTKTAEKASSIAAKKGLDGAMM
jgi:hypothetical protein